MQLISEVKQWYKLWSVQISFLGVLWTTFSDQIVAWWNIHAIEYFPFMSPFAIKWVGLILIILGAVARLIKQGNINANK